MVKIILLPELLPGLLDSFSDAADTPILNHTPQTGQSWSIDDVSFGSGAGKINASGQLQFTSLTQAVLIDAGLSNFQMTVDHAVVNANKALIYFRGADSDNCFVLNPQDNLAGTHNMRLHRRIGGVSTDVFDGAWSRASSTFRILCVANSIKVWEDETLRVDITDNNLITNTKVGLGVGTNGVGPPDLEETFDNLLVRPPP